ncbi:MAG TPA: zf-HC2 domain-containing protein [Ktedonobacterales bacterium]|nr:zf-HC2 domain-containing protein [Ktedonobacterales bacterium]
MSGSHGIGSEGSGEQCRLLAPSLAAFVEGALPPAEMQAIAAHVAGCGWCAAEVAAYAAVTPLLREATSPTPPASLRAGLYARIAAEARRASQRHRTSKLEIVMRETDASQTSAVSAPTQPDRPPSRRRPSPAIARWGGLVAAVLVVGLLAGVLSTRLPGRNTMGQVPRPTATATVQRACAPNDIQASLPARSSLTDLAMTGPDTGWAVGSVADSDLLPTTSHTLILRLSDCQWQPISYSVPNASLESVAAVSPNEIWVVGTQGQGPLLLHYKDGVWSTAVPLIVAADLDAFLLVRAQPNGEVWIAGRTPFSLRGSSTIVLLHLADGQWTRIETPLDDVSDLAPDGPGDAWLVGTKSSSQVYEFAHVQGGALTQEIPANPGIELTKLHMLAANDGWAVGYVPVGGNDTGNNPLIMRPLVLHYDGTRWTQEPGGAMYASARGIDVFGQGMAWAYYTNGGSPEYIVSTRREVGGSWKNVAWPFNDVQSISRLTCVTSDDCWALGSYPLPDRNIGGVVVKGFGSLLLRFANGGWYEYGHVK